MPASQPEAARADPSPLRPAAAEAADARRPGGVWRSFLSRYSLAIPPPPADPRS